MSLRWPDLDRLRRGRGDLLALSRLSPDTVRDKMIAALRRLRPSFAHRGINAPELALIDALAACAEVMGFYHDRFLTESKLGSAQLLDDLAKITAVIGYRPRPAVAATAHQFFEAITAGSVDANTRVAGRAASPPSIVTFETDALIEVSPDLNRMALSPIITRNAGARRVIVAPDAHDALPTDDFLRGQLSVVADAQGLELAQVQETRSRGVAFEGGLSRSFDAESVLSRATVIRHLRDPRALSEDLVAFEVSDGPILHLPTVAAPERLNSTLDIFLLRPGDERNDPSTWNPALRYGEVPDFSGSEVSDHHYRTFVDDGLHTWIILRSWLGAQQLLDENALKRVYARFVPAVGSVLDDTPHGDVANLDRVTLGLDRRYFETSLVAPPTNIRPTANATWAIVDRDLRLVRGDSIIIEGAGGRRWIRTLGDRPPGTSARFLSWEASDPGEAHDAIDCVLDPASTKIAPITDAAKGAALPTWSEFYAQLPARGPFEAIGANDDLPIVPASTTVPSGKRGVIERSRVVAAGTTYLVLDETTHVSVGDFLLVGQRVAADLRAFQPSGPWRWKRDAPPFDPRTPWMDAEVVQVLEVRGNVVRLVTPVSQDYFSHRGWAPSGKETLLSEVIALPGVVSVASGDRLRQTLHLSTEPLYRGSDKKPHEASYVTATLAGGRLRRSAADLRRPLVAAHPHPETVVALSSTADQEKKTSEELWTDLFVAVAGVAEAQTQVTWHLTVAVHPDNLPPAGKLSHLAEDADRGDDGLTDEFAFDTPLALSPAAAARLVGARHRWVIAVLKDQPTWVRVEGAPREREFRVVESVNFDLVPKVRDGAADTLLADGGVMIVTPDKPPADPLSWPFDWDARAGAPRVHSAVPRIAGPFEALLVSNHPRVDLGVPGAVTSFVDWLVPASRFDAALRPAAPGSLVVTAEDRIVRQARFAWRDDGLELSDVRVDSLADPLHGGETVWAVYPDPVRIAPSAVQTRWAYQLMEHDDERLPRAQTIRLALAGERDEIVKAHTADDGRTAIVDDAYAARDLGETLDAMYALEGGSVPGEGIEESTIWTWHAIDPPLTDLPEPADSRFLAVLPSHRVRHLTWRRADVWWEPERRTLRLPTTAFRSPCEPSDVTRLVQLLEPPIDRRQFSVDHDLVTDRSIVTMAIAPGWPVSEMAPAPVVVATRTDGSVEVRDMVAPVDVFTAPGGGVRWSLHFAGDVRDCWRDVSLALGDWSAPAERGLVATPLWRVDAREWREGAQPGPVTLVATERDRPQLRRLAAMLHLDGAKIALAPLGRGDAFPAAAAVESLDMVSYGIDAMPEAPLALDRSIVLELPADRPPGPLTHVVFESGDTWQPIRVTEPTRSPDGNKERYKVDRAYLSLFPAGFVSEQHVRLCYATSPIRGGTARALTLRLHLAGLGKEPARGLGANAAVFHDEDLGDRIVLDAPSVPTVHADTLVVGLALGDVGLDAILDGHGAPRWPSMSLARRWPGMSPADLVRGPCLLELGSPVPYPLALGAGVQLDVHSEQGPRYVSAYPYAADSLHLSTNAAVAPRTITLRGLRIQIAEADLAAGVDLVPTSPQPPWLMSFASDPHPDAFIDTLLPHSDPKIINEATGLRSFQFAGVSTVLEIFHNASDPAKPLYLFTNERDELRSDFYSTDDSELIKDLASDAPPKLLAAPDKTIIDRLVLSSSAWAATQLDKPRPLLVGSTRWKPSPDDPRLPPDSFPEVRVVATKPRRVRTGFVLRSIRFNTGNFIPIAGQVRTPENAAAVIASALHISALPVDLDGNTLPEVDWRTVDYLSLEALTAKAATLADKMATGAGATGTGATYAFSASFSPAGVCTLHFLFIDNVLVETVHVRIETQYEVTPGRAGKLSGRLYPFEAHVQAFDPTSQLALRTPGPLKPEAFVFVRMAHDGPADELQWTKVRRVNGPIVDLQLPIACPTSPALPLEPVEVTTVGKLDNAAKLDGDYYAALAKARLVPGRTLDPPLQELVLPLRDRLPLDVVARSSDGDASLAASLIPGDPVLVFDDRYRRAWGGQRQRHDSKPGAIDWRQWPDFQYRAFVKRIDAEAGLLVLDAPLPDRFQIRWQLDPARHRLTANADDIVALRILPHHGAPVQGPRTLAVLGSGDSTHRFPRFVATLDADVGHAVIPLAEGVMAGNLEVISFDPEKGTWTRWLRHDRLSRAAKKDAAFVLGFRPSDGNGSVPVSVTFGDGLTGQLLPTGTGNVYLRATRIGDGRRWLPQRRSVWVVRNDHPDPELASLRFEVAKTIASDNKFDLVLECAAPAELIGTGDPARVSWRPTIELAVEMPDGKHILQEVSQEDAAGGKPGFYRVSTPDLPPGVVHAFLYVPWAVPETARVTASYVPGPRQWKLDQIFQRDDQLALRDPTVAPGATSLQLLSTTGLRLGSLLAMFPNADSAPDIVRLASVDPPTWTAKLETPLPRAYDLERSFIRGNVTRIVQGAVERVVLGSSDGSTKSLRLPLETRALLYVDKPGSEPEPDIAVFVSQHRWERVLDFEGKQPSSQVWRLDMDADGAPFVVFGDGKQGAIPPAGRDHIEATMRVGAGAAGNLPAAAINKLVTDNISVRSTVNLTNAAGGSAGTTPVVAREKAYAWRLPSDRVVSASDCVGIAIGQNDVLSAALDPTAKPGTLRLVVAFAGRRKPTSADLKAVEQQVRDVMPAAARVRLEVAEAEQKAVHVVVQLDAAEGYVAADVFRKVRAAFGAAQGGFFAAERWDIGEPLRVSAIYDEIFRIDGVAHARVVWLADTPHLEGMPVVAAAPDTFEPGPIGVVRCDNDPADPLGRLGTFRLEQLPEAST